MKRILQVVFIGLGILALAYLGACAYANFIKKDNSGEIKTPTYQNARYIVTIRNTNNTLFTNSYNQYGTNKEVIILHGYYELVGTKYVFKEVDFVLDMSVFGQVDIRLRTPTTTTIGGKTK